MNKAHVKINFDITGITLLELEKMLAYIAETIKYDYIPFSKNEQIVTDYWTEVNESN